MKRYIAILRGINVGGRRKIKMADLKILLAKLEFEKVLTYIQSNMRQVKRKYLGLCLATVTLRRKRRQRLYILRSEIGNSKSTSGFNKMLKSQTN